MRQQTNYNQLVGRKNDSYCFCDYIFKDEDFQGATATILRPVSKAEYEQRMDPDNVQDNFEELWRESVQSGRTQDGLVEFVEEILAVDGDEAVFDFSGCNLWDKLREAVPELTEEDYPVLEYIGGDRSFSSDMEWDEIYNQELWEKIKVVETPCAT